MTKDSTDDDDRPAGPAPETGEPPSRARRRAGAFLGVPIEVTISVGKARPLVSELVELRRDSVLTLDSTIDDPVELYIGDRLIARGELQEIGDDSGTARRAPDRGRRLLARALSRGDAPAAVRRRRPAAGTSSPRRPAAAGCGVRRG